MGPSAQLQQVQNNQLKQTQEDTQKSLTKALNWLRDGGETSFKVLWNTFQECGAADEKAVSPSSV